MPTKAKIKKKPKRNTWVYIYGDEMLEIWEHFGIDFPNPDDRMKLKQKNKTTVIYIDKKRKRQYTYSTLGFIKEKKL